MGRLSVGAAMSAGGLVGREVGVGFRHSVGGGGDVMNSELFSRVFQSVLNKN